MKVRLSLSGMFPAEQDDRSIWCSGNRDAGFFFRVGGLWMEAIRCEWPEETGTPSRKARMGSQHRIRAGTACSGGA